MQRLALQVATQVFSDALIVALPEFFGETGGVGCDQKIFQVP